MSQGKDNARLRSYKNKSFNTDEMRRRREEEGLQLRKQKKDEQVRWWAAWGFSEPLCTCSSLGDQSLDDGSRNSWNCSWLLWRISADQLVCVLTSRPVNERVKKVMQWSHVDSGADVFLVIKYKTWDYSCSNGETWPQWRKTARLRTMGCQTAATWNPRLITWTRSR